MKKIIALMVVAGLLTGCSPQKKETVKLRSQINALKAELKANQEAAQTLQVIWSLIDSIDMSRQALKSKMIVGASIHEYEVRMRDIGKYVAEAERRIAGLESGVLSLRSSMSAYVATTRKLREGLEMRNAEMASLQSQFDQFQNQNVNLIQTVDLQKAEIMNNLSEIDQRQREIATLESRVSDLLVDTHRAEADAYLKRARAVEEIANRTRFAPKKKKETTKEALELYKMAAFYGSQEAKAKVSELETQI